MKIRYLSLMACTLASFSAMAATQVMQSIPEKSAVIDATRVATALVLGKNTEKDINVRAVMVDND